MLLHNTRHGTADGIRRAVLDVDGVIGCDLVEGEPGELIIAATIDILEPGYADGVYAEIVAAVQSVAPAGISIEIRLGYVGP